MAVDCTGSFSAPAPQIQNLTVTQPQTTDALGNAPNSTDPVTANNALISFQWRGLDPDTTDITFFFDENNSGYKGVVLNSLSGDDLLIGDPDADGWRTVTVPWDLGDLKPGVPLYVYGVIRDAAHVPVKTDYAGQVQSVPAAQIQVTYQGNTDVTANELQALPLSVTPVKDFDLQSIRNGVVTVASTDGLSIGDTFMFHGLTSTSGVSNGTPYSITSISGTTFRYSTTAGGAAITGSSADAGIAYVDQGPASFYATDQKGLVSPHVDVSQTYRFSMAPTRSVFVGQPTANQELSWTNELMEYNTFPGKNQLLRMQFEFQIKAAIAGTIYNDFEDDGQLDSFDTGLAGATVFLDDNNNDVLDNGEQFATTGYDGAYLLTHNWSETDTSSSTYTTWVKVIPPAGYKITSSPSIPSEGITFVNDGRAQPALNYYNFPVAAPITLSGTVYADTNQNGVRDAGEKGISGVSVTITPPSGDVIHATTDANGVWTATGYARGSYGIAVSPPTGGTITTPSTVFSTSATGSIVLNSPYDATDHYSQSVVTSVWNPATNQYEPWLLALIDGMTNSGPGVNFVNLSHATSGNVNVQNTSLLSPPDQITPGFDVFLGMWTGDGVPGPAIAAISNHQAMLAISPTNTIDRILFHSLGTPNADERFALSYDPSKPNYSTLASINAQRQIVLWNYDPTKLGLGEDDYQPFMSPGVTLFQLPSGTPEKMVGFNMSGSDHFKSQDLAIVYLSDIYNVPQLAIWNHSTNAIQSVEIGGRAVVDMIAGDFDANGREDIAVLTTDVTNQNYYLTILLTQPDGSVKVLRHEGADLALASDGTSLTNLASIQVDGGRQAILWTTQDGDAYINAALVTGDQLRITTSKTAFAGHIVAVSPGEIDTGARFAIYAPGPTAGHGIAMTEGTITLNVNGQITVDPLLTQHGGTFSGFDIGLTGVSPAASTVTSGIVYNDLNSNGFQDPGESGLPGISVRLITLSGNTTTITSDESDGRAIGSYSFDQVPANSSIQVILPGGTWLAQNPPRCVDTNSNGTDCLQIGVSFTEGAILETIPFDATTDNPFSVNIKSGDLQQKGKENLILRTSDSIYVQYFGVDGSTSFIRYDVSSTAGYFKPELELADVNGDGRLDIVTSGQAGVDVLINIGFGQFKPYLGLLADQLNNKPNGAYSVKGAFTGDVDSGVTSAKTYTHALNFNGSATTVNGVTFQPAGTTGSNFKLEFLDSATATPGTAGSVQGFPNTLSGGMNELASSFYYSYGDSNGGQRLTLTGLTGGVTYTTTFYAVGYGSVGERKEMIFDSLGGSVTLDENASGNGNGFTFSRTFTATSDSITFTFKPLTPPHSFHQYALTNEVAAVGYTTIAPLSGDDDSTLDAGHHYTDTLDFAGDQSVTINGVPFTQATPQGSNYSLVSYDPTNQTTSNNLNVLTGYDNALTGQMESASSNFYYSPTTASQLTLTGLLPGATYTTTFYGVGFGVDVPRVSTITENLGGSVVVNENAFGDRQGFQFSRTFVATSDQITYTFIAADSQGRFHHYALTNQLVDDNANYLFQLLPGDAGSDVSASKT